MAIKFVPKEEAGPRLIKSAKQAREVVKAMAAIQAATPSKPKEQGTQRGRPPKPDKLERTVLYLDQRVLAHYRATGEGWQARLNAALVASLPR